MSATPRTSTFDWRLAAFGGAIAGAAAVGVVWLLASGGSSSGIGHASLTPPATVGRYVRLADSKLSTTAAGRRQSRTQEAWDARSASAIAAAYGGAATLVTTYTDNGFVDHFVLLEVRAPTTPRLYTLYVDPRALYLVRPVTEVRTYGHVDCYIDNQPTVRGKTPPADSVGTFECLRSDKHLTVGILQPGGDLNHHPDRVAALVDRTWPTVS